MLTKGKTNLEQLKEALGGGLATEEALRSALKGNSFVFFGGELVLHLKDGVFIAPENGDLSQAYAASQKNTKEKAEIVEAFKKKVEVYSYILENMERSYEMIEFPKTLAQLQAFYKENTRARTFSEFDLEDFGYDEETGACLQTRDFEHSDEFTLFRLKDGIVIMNYEWDRDQIKDYAWSPRLLEKKDIPALQKDLERAYENEKIGALEFAIAFLEKQA